MTRLSAIGAATAAATLATVAVALAALVDAAPVLAQEAARAPLASQPPIQGPGWTVAVPAVLFLVTAAGTWALWRHFADQDDDEE